MKKLLIAILLLLIVQPGAVCQQIDKAKLDTFFDLLDENNQTMGSVSVMIDGKEVYARSIGFEDLEKGAEAGPESRYRIGSISKTFTAVIIMQLVEEGKLSLDAKLSDFYPDFPNADMITVEQLLRHRSGLFNFTNKEDFGEWMESPMSKAELIDKLVANGSVFEPDAKYEYSNTNYVLLTYIAEDTDGHPYPEILYNRITKACGLENTYYGEKIGEKDNEAFSYTPGEPWSQATETDMSIPQGAGAIVSTASDISRFFWCLFNGKLVNEESLGHMTNIEDGYGLGLFQFPFEDRKAYGHNGGIDGFQTSAGYFPGDNIAVAYLSNGSRYPVNSVMIGVMSNVFGAPFELPVFHNVSNAVLDRYTGTYASPDLPIDLRIFREGSQLKAQGTGQPAFPLTPVDDTTFKFDPAGLSINFKPEENKLVLSQGPGKYEMTRKEE